MAATSPSDDTIQYFKTCSEGSHGLYFRPTSWDRWGQLLEVTVGELLPDQPVPLLNQRLKLRREEEQLASCHRLVTKLLHLDGSAGLA